MILPKNTELGQLRLENVYTFYDMPRLFTCVCDGDATHHPARYMVMCDADDDFIADWHYLRISDSRVQELRDQKVTLAWAYQHPEDGYVYWVESDYDGNAGVQRILPDHPSLRDMPDMHIDMDDVYPYQCS